MRIACTLLLVALACRAGFADGAQPSTDLGELKRQAQADFEKERARLPNIGERSLADIVEFVTRDGKLYPLSHLAPTGPAYVELRGLGGWARIQVTEAKALRISGGERYLQQFDYRDLSDAGSIEVRTEVDFGLDRMEISRWTSLADDGAMTVQFIETAAGGPEGVMLYIQNMPPGRPPMPQVRVAGATLAVLTLNHPAEVNQSLRPIFRMLGQEQVVFKPDDRWAYQVVQDLLPIDPEEARRTGEAVKQLDADSYADREAAMGRLRGLGETAAIELMRHPLANLTTEQTMRVNLFLSAYQPLEDEQAKRLRGDADFLLDCQFSSDARLRRVAMEQLRRIGGASLRLDERQSGAALAEALARVRPRR